MIYTPTLISIIEVLLVAIPALLSVAFVTVAERKTMASMQRRLGPNIVGYYGLLQAFADALKLLLKEYISPTQANIVLFFLGPIITLIFSLLGYAVVPYGPGLTVWDFNLGIIYMLAVSSLSTYGILLAGWSANSKYAFLGSLRSTAQLISYELILSSAILIVILLTGTLSLTMNVEAQRAVWFILPLLPVFIIFFIGSVAETNRAPFDLAEADFIKIKPKEGTRLNPYWVTGFTDGEGSFVVKIFKDVNTLIGWRVQPTFQIKLNIRDLNLLEQIKTFFGVGTIRFTKNACVFTVTSLKDLMFIVLKHFDDYPLVTQKWSDYKLFKSIVFILINEKNSLERFVKILGYRYYLNLGISEELKNLYPKIIPVPRPIVPTPSINKNWLIGFIDGEGCFYINIIKKPTGHSVWLLFQITQHIRDIELLNYISLFLGCGTVNPRSVTGKGANAADFEVSKLAIIQKIIIPYMFDELKSSKSKDFNLFCEAADIIKNKKGRTWNVDDISTLTFIKNKMNKYN